MCYVCRIRHSSNAVRYLESGHLSRIVFRGLNVTYITGTVRPWLSLADQLYWRFRYYPSAADKLLYALRHTLETVNIRLLLDPARVRPRRGRGKLGLRARVSISRAGQRSLDTQSRRDDDSDPRSTHTHTFSLSLEHAVTARLPPCACSMLRLVPRAGNPPPTRCV
jgi:hypothetical protein